MADHTPTPWTHQRAKTPTNGQYDCAISAVSDGKRHIIAETFGRAATDVFPDSEANAAFIVKAVNNHAALEDFAVFVECWVSNPVGSYSVAALDGLFEMTRDRIAALASIKERA